MATRREKYAQKKKTSLQEAQGSVKGEDVIVSRTINCCVRINKKKKKKKSFLTVRSKCAKGRKGRSSETRQGRLNKVEKKKIK